MAMAKSRTAKGWTAGSVEAQRGHGGEDFLVVQWLHSVLPTKESTRASTKTQCSQTN